MSHDADKLIRQLSLVAFLMAERRPLTARDVKSNVEGYSEMSDEAFARRFYSDRAELTALGVPLQSQRDEFTGEELYTLRSEHYFLDRLELDDDELAGRLSKLESAISKQRTVRFGYWSPRRARPAERVVNPFALRLSVARGRAVAEGDRALLRDRVLELGEPAGQLG